MSTVAGILKSSLGRKYVMAGTGILLFLFVVGHLVGNLQVFGPPELINTYAHFLQSKPLMVWGARIGLLVLVGLHVTTAVQLSLANQAARPVGYAGRGAYGSTWQSRYMLGTGIVIAAFILYHLAHFTALLPGINGVGDFSKLKTVLHGEPVRDVYAMMVLGFQVWWVALFYLVAQALLFIHLGHGLASLFQTLGLRNHVWWPRIQLFARGASLAVFIGFALIPISIYLRVVGADYAEMKKAELKSAAMVEAVVPAGKAATH
ncbi:MAG: succinate dehydrogenase cytochrome b subunit [Verrucomicrobia subdivision 3 bacterium]|nr:succinate dehydrogenase cytochrome b subunit [Limisphaerales bacterium]